MCVCVCLSYVIMKYDNNVTMWMYHVYLCLALQVAHHQSTTHQNATSSFTTIHIADVHFNIFIYLASTDAAYLSAS